MNCPKCGSELLKGKDAIESLSQRYGGRIDALALINNIMTDLPGLEWAGYCPTCNAFIGRGHPALTELKITLGNKTTKWKIKRENGWVHFVESPEA